MDECFQPRPGQTLIHHIITDHIAAVGIQNPADNMPYQSHADDRHSLTRNHFRLMNSLQRDSAQGAESRLPVVGQFLRHSGEHGSADPVDLAVIGSPHHRHQIPGLNLRHAFSAGDDAPHTGIPHGHGFRQLVERALHGRHDPVCGQLLQHLFHLIRALHGLLNQVLPSKGSKSPLSPGTDHRIQTFHQRHIFLYNGNGLIQQLRTAVFYI